MTNLIGNGVATIVVSIREGELDRAKMDAALADVRYHRSPQRARSTSSPGQTFALEFTGRAAARAR